MASIQSRISLADSQCLFAHKSFENAQSVRMACHTVCGSFVDNWKKEEEKKVVEKSENLFNENQTNMLNREKVIVSWIQLITKCLIQCILSVVYLTIASFSICWLMWVPDTTQCIAIGIFDKKNIWKIRFI